MKKALVVVVVVLLLGVGLVGSLSSSASAETLTIWVGGQAAQLGDSWNEAISRYEDDTGHDVEIQRFGFSAYYDKLTTALAGGSGPDLAFADLGGWVPTFAKRGWLTPMEEELQSWDGTDTIWENLWPTVTYEGERYGLPWYTDDRLLLYNKKMFRDAGLDPEDPPKHWEELAYAAKKLTDEGKRVYGYGVSGTRTEHATLGYMIFLYGAGGQLLTDDYSEAAFDSEAGLRALKFYTDLANKWEVSPKATSNNEDDYRDMMAQNRVAMAIGGPWSFPLIEKANPDVEYAVSMHPYATEPASVLGGWALVIPKSSSKKELAWGLAKHLTSYETWMFWIEEEGGPMPVRKDVANDAPALQTENWQTVFDAYSDAVPRPPIPEYPEVSNQIRLMIQDVLLGNATPEEAISKAAEEVNDILAD